MGLVALKETDEYNDELDFNYDERCELATEIVKVFKAWGLSTMEQSMVLGLSENGRSTINRYAKGSPVAQNYDLLWRIGNLLSIFHMLRSTDIDRPERADKWVTRTNPSIGGRRPVDLMRNQNGISAIRTWLEVRGEW